MKNGHDVYQSTKPISITFADWCDAYSDVLMVFGEYLDMYQSAILHTCGINKEKIDALKTHYEKVEKNRRACESIVVRCMPHWVLVSGYRNELLSLAINECTENERILAIYGGMHVWDIVDRLTGKVLITNPIKNVHESRDGMKFVIAQKWEQHNYKGYNVQHKLNGDVDFIVKTFGINLIDAFKLPLDDDGQAYFDKIASKQTDWNAKIKLKQ